ncbi:MAG: J domain-containing protein [Calditrichaeota bacterium]|nr:MAG: J domain-containing protein [Calditrichota bacterium]
MSEKDFYKILGVSEGADEQEIKKAYRELAKKYHPDKHKGDKRAEERFKDIAEAYSVLSDPKKRAQYDQIRRYGGEFSGNFTNFDASQFSDFFRTSRGKRSTGSGGAGDLFSEFFGGWGTGERYSAQKGEDITAEITIPFDTAIQGGGQSVFINGKQLSIKIQPMIEEGKKIRLSGQGHSGISGGTAGDLLLTIHVAEHPVYRRNGLDIYSSQAIDMVQAALGCKVRIQTYNQGHVELKVPAGTQPGKRFKLNGMGLSHNGQQGDHVVEIVVTIPQKLSAKAKSLLQQYAQETGLA